MKNKILKAVYFLFAVIVFSSCVPGKELVFESLTPAEYTLPVNTEKIIVFNSSYTPEFDTMDFNVLRRLEEDEQFIIDTLIINNIFNGFFYVADQSPVQGLRNSVYVEERSDDSINFLKYLSNESIRFLLEEFEADVVISMEYYGMNYDYFTQAEEFEQQAFLLLDRALLWRLYTDTGMVKEVNMRDTLYWTAYGVNRKDAIENLPDLTKVIKETFWFAGESFASKLSPSWEETRRSYFLLTDQGTDQSLDPAYLREVATDNNKIRAYKAYFNLSIYHEKQGEIEKALEYMNAALEIRPGAALARFYRKKLVGKMEEFGKLKKQIN